MSKITIPIEIDFTPRSRAIMEALYKTLDPKFQADDTAEQPEPAQATAAPALNLQPGEHYAGVVLDANGNVTHHLVLMAERPTNKLNWQAAMDWAKRVGGDLPTRQEQALLFANCKPHLQADWHWSNQTHDDDTSYAWYCYFYGGFQSSNRKIYEGCAVAVRRV